MSGEADIVSVSSIARNADKLDSSLLPTKYFRKTSSPEADSLGASSYLQQPHFVDSRTNAPSGSQTDRKVVCSRGPKLRYIVIDGSNIAME